MSTARIKITELNGGQDGQVMGSNVYAAVDTTDVTQAPSGTTKRYQISQLVTFFMSAIGLTAYESCITCSTTNLNATYQNGALGVNATLTNNGAFAPFSINGRTGVFGDRYLIKDQTDPAQNGIYILTIVGTASTAWGLTRALDFNSSSNIINNSVVFIETGTSFANTTWQLSFSGVLTVGTTLLNFSLFDISPDLFFTWNTVTGSTQQLSVLSGYVVTNVAQTTLTLPAAANIGDQFIIKGNLGCGGFKIAQNASQRIIFGDQITTAGILGYIDNVAGQETSSIQITYISSNVWSVDSSIGNFNVI